MNKVVKHILGWFIAAVFFFPIYFWITVSIKKDKDIFALPPKLFNFDLSFQAYEEVFGISRFLYVEDMGAVRPPGLTAPMSSTYKKREIPKTSS